MKLLLDENLSDRIVGRIIDLYPGSLHVKSISLIRSDDSAIWQYAADNGYTLISKDADFHHRSLLEGYPPKFIFLRVGNCPTDLITNLLRSNHALITDFEADPRQSILILFGS